MENIIKPTKKCIKCNTLKELNMFHKSCIYKDGHISTCKMCRNSLLRKPKGDPKTTKVCNKCKIEKPLEQFHNRKLKSGTMSRFSICKICEKQYREDNKIRISIKMKKYTTDHKLELLQKSKEYYKKMNIDGNINRKNKERQFKKDYNISITDKEQIFANQNYQCLICNIDLKEDYINNPGNVCIDHNHITNKIRGILCRNCNSALGGIGFNENIDTINSAIVYLTNYNNQLIENIQTIKFNDDLYDQLELNPQYKKCDRCFKIKLLNEFRKTKGTENKIWYSKYCEVCSRLFHKYKITERHYDYMLNKQEYKCAICNKLHNIDKYHNKLCIDHDAKTNDNIIRGLLCRKCNLTIGFVKHDISILNSMIIYLNKFKDPL